MAMPPIASAAADIQTMRRRVRGLSLVTQAAIVTMIMASSVAPHEPRENDRKTPMQTAARLGIVTSRLRLLPRIVPFMR
jgi:hypothetical protein